MPPPHTHKKKAHEKIKNTPWSNIFLTHSNSEFLSIHNLSQTHFTASFRLPGGLVRQGRPNSVVNMSI